MAKKKTHLANFKTMLNACEADGELGYSPTSYEVEENDPGFPGKTFVTIHVQWVGTGSVEFAFDSETGKMIGLEW